MFIYKMWHLARAFFKEKLPQKHQELFLLSISIQKILTNEKSQFGRNGSPKKGVKFWMNSYLFKICTRNTVLKIPIIRPFFEGKNMDTIVVLVSRMVLSHYCGTWLLLWYLATIVILGHYCDTWPLLWSLATIAVSCGFYILTIEV